MFKVLFSKKAEEQIQQLAKEVNASDEKKHAAKLLKSTVNLINQVYYSITDSGYTPALITASFYIYYTSDLKVCAPFIVYCINMDITFTA